MRASKFRGNENEMFEWPKFMDSKELLNSERHNGREENKTIIGNNVIKEGIQKCSYK